jgi:hypothetical protein
MSLEDIQKSREKMNGFAREKGRDPSIISVAPESICGIDNDSREAQRGFVASLIYQHLLSLRKSILKLFANKVMPSFELFALVSVSIDFSAISFALQGCLQPKRIKYD